MAGQTINVSEVWKLLGRLEASVGNLTEDVQDIKESQEEAKVARETMSHQLAGLVGRLNMMDQKVASAAEIAEEVKQWKQRGIGALFVVGIGSSAITALIVKFWTTIVVALQSKVGG